MRPAMSLRNLMGHMREAHGFDDLQGEARRRRLRNMGYFHGFKGFRYVRRPSDRLGLSSFGELESVYGFDARMKAALYPRVMEVETALKNVVLARVLEGCSEPSLSAFLREGLDPCRLEDGSVSRSRMRDNLRLKATLQATVRDSYKQPHVRHYVDREGDAPMWSVFESMSLGTLSLLARCLRPDIEAMAARDVGIPEASGRVLADVVEVIRPLRNCIAHNNVIFDARFSQAVRYGGGNASVAMAGALVRDQTGLGYAPEFRSIVDYVVFLAMLLFWLTRRKGDARRFVRECRRALDGLRADVGIDMYMKIVGSGDRQKLDAALAFVSAR